jgi:hypothetical protein
LLHPAYKLDTHLVGCFLETDIYPIALEAELQEGVIVIGDAVILQQKRLWIGPGAAIGLRSAIGRGGEAEAIQPTGTGGGA